MTDLARGLVQGDGSECEAALFSGPAAVLGGSEGGSGRSWSPTPADGAGRAADRMRLRALHLTASLRRLRELGHVAETP